MKERKVNKSISKAAKETAILDDIAKGTTYRKMLDKYSDLWGLSKGTIKNIIHDVVQDLRDAKIKEDIIAMNMERLDNIISDSFNDGDRKHALKGIDMQNKLAGGYEEKVALTSDGEVKFIFDIGE